MTKEERARIRQATAEAVTGLTPETMGDAVRRLSTVVLPDPKAEPNRAGLRVARDVVQEAAVTLGRRLRNREKLDEVVRSLWASGVPEARALSAYGVAPLLPAGDEEGERLAVERIRACLLESKRPGVGDALADTVSREVEGGRGTCWMQAAAVWAEEGDVRLRSFGPDMYAHLFGRGESPEKLFDALKVAEKLMGDPDPSVRASVRSLLLSSTKKHAPAVGRFLSKYEGDDRPDVRGLVEEMRKKVEERGKEIELELESRLPR